MKVKKCQIEMLVHLSFFHSESCRIHVTKGHITIHTGKLMPHICQCHLNEYNSNVYYSARCVSIRSMNSCAGRQCYIYSHLHVAHWQCASCLCSGYHKDSVCGFQTRCITKIWENKSLQFHQISFILFQCTAFLRKQKTQMLENQLSP